MVAAANIRAAQAFSLGTAEYATDMLIPQAYVLAAASYAAEQAYIPQAFVLAATQAPNTIYAPQAFILVAAIGRVTDPAIRVWTYTLDGHDYYVLRLGNEETLVCDLSNGQWSTFGSGDTGLWRAYSGTNWLGAESVSGGYGSNIIVGDDGNGALYFLNPDKDTDDDALVGPDNPRRFHRAVVGQITARGYDAHQVFSATLYGSIGEQADEDLQTVTLSTSDDVGDTYDDRGTITLPEGEHLTRLVWRSLGSARYPGRLFKVEDYGALKRIDNMEVEAKDKKG